MYDVTLDQFKNLNKPIELIVVGLGFMGFGFISSLRSIPNVRVPLLISRRPLASVKYLEEHGLRAVRESSIEKIKENAGQGIISVSDNRELISNYPSQAVFEVTGTVDYGTDAAIKALKSKNI